MGPVSHTQKAEKKQVRRNGDAHVDLREIRFGIDYVEFLIMRSWSDLIR